MHAPVTHTEDHSRQFGALVRGRRATWISRKLREPFSSCLRNLHNKPYAYTIAKTMGLPVPEMHQYGRSLFEVFTAAQDASFEKFVIKPVVGKNSLCVLPLVREGAQIFFHTVERRSLSVDDIIYNAIRVYRKEKIGLQKDGSKGELHGQWLLEDLLERPDGLSNPIDDFKFYGFYGDISCILHKRNVFSDGSWKSLVQWYDSDWNVIDTGKYGKRIDRSLRPPESRCQLSQLARKISLLIPLPFCRIDLYDTSMGPMLGELTTVPGDPDKFSSRMDGVLASSWASASKRLEVEIRNGLLDEIEKYYFMPSVIKK